MLKAVVGVVAALAVVASPVVAQDPAEGWMGYAVGTNPSGGRILHMEAKWKVGETPVQSDAFFSPWFGVESSDNLNLLQPVNPWDGSSWSIYNEYFQWSPVHNQNSASHRVKAGDILYGSVTLNTKTNAYVVHQSSLSDGWSVNMTIPVQKDRSGQYKKFTIAYIVYEKVWECNLYPGDGEVTFYDIAIQWEGSSQTTKWATSYVDDNCNNRAQVVDSSTIKITWDVDGVTSKNAMKNEFGSINSLHPNAPENFPISFDNSTCPSGQTECEYLPGKTQCCTAGEHCIKNVGCRC